MTRHSNYSPHRPSGFTLIEVVASLMLVGTLLVAVLMAHRRAAQQTRLAQKRITAIAALDQLLTWRADPAPELAGEVQQPTGRIPGDSPYYWRTSERFDAAAEPLQAMIMHVEVFDPEFNAGETLSHVEMLVPSGRQSRGQYAQP